VTCCFSAFSSGYDGRAGTLPVARKRTKARSRMM